MASCMVFLPVFLLLIRENVKITKTHRNCRASEESFTSVAFFIISLSGDSPGMLQTTPWGWPSCHRKSVSEHVISLNMPCPSRSGRLHGIRVHSSWPTICMIVTTRAHFQPPPVNKPTGFWIQWRPPLTVPRPAWKRFLVFLPCQIQAHHHRCMRMW